MRFRSLVTGAAVLALTGTAVVGMTMTAHADLQPGDPGYIDIGVTIPRAEGLWMTIAPGSLTLAENGSDATARRFTGTLPQVTVEDDRSVPPATPNSAWYVMGQISAVTESGSPTTHISKADFGWEPAMVSSTGTAPVGTVVAGPDVDPDVDGGPGLIGDELLVASMDNVLSNTGVYVAKADVTLAVPPSVTPGAYGAVLTLTLTEE